MNPEQPPSPAQPENPNTPVSQQLPVSSQPDRVSDLLSTASAGVVSQPPARSKRKLVLVISVASAVLVVGVVAAVVLLLKQDNDPVQQTTVEQHAQQVNYQGLAPQDIFNTLISELKTDSSVVAGPIHKGIDAGGNAFQNMTTVHEPTSDTMLLVQSTHGGVEFTVADEAGAGQPCKERLGKVASYREKLAQALVQAGYTAQKTAFMDGKTARGDALCVESTAYYNETNKNYCSEERMTGSKALTFAIACTDQKRGDDNLARAKEVIPVLKSAAVSFSELSIIVANPQQSPTTGYERMLVIVRPSVLGDVGLYRKTGQPWKVLPGNASGAVDFECTILAKDPDIAKAYAGRNCYDTAVKKSRPI